MDWLLTILGGTLFALAVCVAYMHTHQAVFKAKAWEEGYGQGVADAWQSMDYDGGKTPAARINPYRDWKTGLAITYSAWRQRRRAARARVRLSNKPSTKFYNGKHR